MRAAAGSCDALAEVGVARVAVPARGLGGDHGRLLAAPGQGALGEGVCRQYPATAAEAGRQYQVGEPDQPGVVLDERGLGLLDVDYRAGGPGGGGCGTLVYFL